MTAAQPARHPDINSSRHMTMLAQGNVNEFLDNFESEIQLKMIETLHNVGIQASVKTDKFSLPYDNENIVIVPFTSYANAVLKYPIAFKVFVKELLELEVRRIRFYIWIDLFEYDGRKLGSRNFLLRYGGLKYHLRYFINR